VYARPADATVARLTGPVSSLDAPFAAGPAGTVSLDVGGVPATVVCDGAGMGPLLLRPDWAGLDGDLPGLVTAVRFAGPHTDYAVESPAGTVLIRESGPPRRAVGEVTGWSLHRVWLAGSGGGGRPATVPSGGFSGPTRPRG
jgi:hypothetical protein